MTASRHEKLRNEMLRHGYYSRLTRVSINTQNVARECQAKLALEISHLYTTDLRIQAMGISNL